MPLSLTTNQTTEVALKPALKSKLLRELKVYAEICGQIKALESAKDKHKGIVDGLRDEAGVTSLAIEGFKVTHVTSTRSSLNKMKLLGMGVTTDMLEEATDYKPGKPFLKITLPGEKSYEGGE